MRAQVQPYYDKKRCILSDAVPLDTPLTVFIQPSTLCNIKCNYCIQSASKEEKKAKNINDDIMDMDIFLEILEQLKRFPKKIKDISFTGMGEPLCNKNLPKMIKMVKEADIAERVQFFTNALLLTKETSLELIEAGLDELRISLQGLTSEKYYEICGAKIQYSSLLDNIRFFYKNRKDCKLYIKIADIALDGNKDDFYDTFGDISDTIFIERIVPLFEEIDYEKIIDTSISENKYREHYKEYFICPNCFYTINISPRGDVMPCCAFYNPPLANLINKSLVDIWNGEERKRFLLMQLKKERLNNPNCKNCFVPNNQQPEDFLDDSAEEIIIRL